MVAVKHLPDQGIVAGPVVESIPPACPSCGAPWPGESGHVKVGWEHCSGCSGSRHGGHRTWTCLRCWVENYDQPCDRLGGERVRYIGD